jgi:hypothetical protein
LKLSHTYSLLLYLFNFLSHKITKKEWTFINYKTIGFV